MTRVKQTRTIVAVIVAISIVFSLFGLSLLQKTKAEEAKDITITLDYNGGIRQWDSAERYTVQSYEGAYFTPPSSLYAVKPPAENKMLSGWYKDKACTEGNEVKAGLIYEDATYYAKWDDSATIKIEDLVTSIMPEKTEWSETVLAGKLNDFRVYVYESPGKRAFGGLYTEPEGKGTLITDTIVYNDQGEGSTNGIISFSLKADNNTQLYVNWKKPVILEFDANGGVLPDNAPTYQRRASGIHWINNWNDLNKEPIPTREGYTFVGWSADKEATTGVALNDYIATKSESLYAVWEKSKQDDADDPDDHHGTEPSHIHNRVINKGWEATCTEVGSSDWEVCSDCGEILKPQIISKALGHDYKDGICTRCGAKDPSKVEPGKPDPVEPVAKLNGLVQGSDGKWAMYKDGKVDTSATGVFQNKNGWWRVEKGYVNFKAQGIYQNQYGWWKTTNGKVTFKENGVFQNEFGWWKVKDSKVDFSFTGIASNKYGSWYIKGGKVDFNKNGKVNYNNKTYTIKNGKVV